MQERKEMKIRRQKRIDSLRRIEAGDETALEDYLGAAKRKVNTDSDYKIAMNVSRQLRKLKSERSVFIKDIASSTNISKRTINRLMNGQINKPVFSNIVALADYFEVSTDYFRGKSDD